jgi:predicted nucleotide-binding protein
MNVGWLGIVPDWDESRWEQYRAELLKTQLLNLETLVELLETEERLSAGHPANVEPAVHGHAVFVVHGHQHGLKEEVARFLEKLRQEVRILHEQPNLGKTLIEKFEQHADVAFAVVLLTPDDRGGPVSAEPPSLKLRARQNVIFELGYFVGRLGRSRVCALFAPDVELPSDYQGVAFVPVDESGAWRFALAKELKAAGLTVDLNLAV